MLNKFIGKKLKMFYKKLFHLLAFPFSVYMFNSIFQTVGIYSYYIYSIDTLSHFLGGLAIAYSADYALALIEKKKWIVIKKNILRACIIVLTVTTIAVVWEFYEFTYDQILWGNFMQPSVADTIKDLCMGVIGAMVFSSVKLYQTDKKSIKKY